jgi:hypothetical protein
MVNKALWNKGGLKIQRHLVLDGKAFLIRNNGHYDFQELSKNADQTIVLVLSGQSSKSTTWSSVCQFTRNKALA